MFSGVFVDHSAEHTSKEASKPFLPEEFAAKAAQGLQQRHGRYLKAGELFQVSGRAEPDAYIICITFENSDASLHLPVEVALVHRENPRCTADEARDVLVDFVDYYFDRYFKGARHVTLPIDWKDFPFGEFTLRARGWERNKKLEDAADRLLAGEPIDNTLD